MYTDQCGYVWRYIITLHVRDVRVCYNALVAYGSYCNQHSIAIDVNAEAWSYGTPEVMITSMIVYKCYIIRRCRHCKGCCLV